MQQDRRAKKMGRPSGRPVISGCRGRHPLQNILNQSLKKGDVKNNSLHPPIFIVIYTTRFLFKIVIWINRTSVPSKFKMKVRPGGVSGVA